jgi:esterase/lipase superfamily enzyme
MKRFTLFTLVLLLNCIYIFAQEKISGIVTDGQGIALPGITVSIRGAKVTTSTDFNGKFNIEIVDRNSFLIFSYIGMTTTEIFVGDQTELKVKLADSHDLLEEVVVSTANLNTSKPEGKKNYALVRVYFATDRNRIKSKEPAEMFGTKRANSVSYGVCDVSIPRNHKKGVLEDASLFKLQYKNDPEKHISLLKVDVRDKDNFFSKVRAGVDASPDKKAFIFIHGYNVSFEDASRRTAQMTYDLGFKGAPVFYSWPSVNEILGYNIDEGNNEWSETNLKVFLNDFLSKSDAKNIYLIAHSMGNRMLTRALVSIIAENPENAKRIKEIILAAPDIDADVFKNVIAPALIKNNNPVTLYVSSNDWALYMSRKFSSYPRAGQTGEAMTILTGMDTIDATNVNCGLLGHSYIGDAPDVLSDISIIIKSKFRADNREGLSQLTRGEEIFWEFK